MAGVLFIHHRNNAGSISVAIVDLLPGIFRCTPKLPALAVSRLPGNSPWSRLMIAVLFEADALPQAQERYLQLAAGLTPLLSDTPGFIAIERFQSLSTPGKILRYPGGKMKPRWPTGSKMSGIWLPSAKAKHRFFILQNTRRPRVPGLRIGSGSTVGCMTFT